MSSLKDDLEMLLSKQRDKDPEPRRDPDCTSLSSENFLNTVFENTV
jgi:hypothetical protein